LVAWRQPGAGGRDPGTGRVSEVERGSGKVERGQLRHPPAVFFCSIFNRRKQRKQPPACGRAAWIAGGEDGRTPRRLSPLSFLKSETITASGRRLLGQYPVIADCKRSKQPAGTRTCAAAKPRPAPSATVRLQAAHAEGWQD